MKSGMKSVITCDLEGRIETFTHDAEAVFGWTRDEVVGKKRVSLFSPGEVVLEHVPRWLKTAVDQGAYETDTVFVRKDGAQFPAHIRVSPTFKKGVHIGYCGVTEPLPESELARAMPKISAGTKVFRWLVVTRAPFLTASIAPVLVGAAVAARFVHPTPLWWALFALAFVGACALHIAANTWNDVFDWESGADEGNNDYFLPFSGGSRSIELRLITERGLRRLAFGSLVVAALCGAAVTALSTPWVLAFGVAGAFAAYFYTAPPLRLVARHGLGELLVGLCFGPLMTGGVFAAVTGWHPGAAGLDVAMLAGIPVGLLCAAILWINEFPDAASDAAAGKNHLVVTLGTRGAQVGFTLVVLGAFAAAAVLAALQVLPLATLAIFLTLPFALRALAVLYRHVGDRALITANKSTITLHALAGVVYAAAVVLG